MEIYNSDAIIKYLHVNQNHRKRPPFLFPWCECGQGYRMSDRECCAPLSCTQPLINFPWVGMQPCIRARGCDEAR